MSGPECGFKFPEEIKERKIKDFVQIALKTIHKAFYQEKTTLTRNERLTFIELFYLLFTLKICEELECDSLSFTCKDGLDTSESASAMLFGLMRFLSNTKAWTEKEKDQLLWILYSPALLVRERAMVVFSW